MDNQEILIPMTKDSHAAVVWRPAQDSFQLNYLSPPDSPVIPEAEALAEAIRDLPHANPLPQIPAHRGALRRLAGMTGRPDVQGAQCRPARENFAE
jgi:hypothetical protein